MMLFMMTKNLFLLFLSLVVTVDDCVNVYIDTHQITEKYIELERTEEEQRKIASVKKDSNIKFTQSEDENRNAEGGGLVGARKGEGG